MSRIDRIARKLAALEADYLSSLEAALRDCAAGVWGLFGQNERFEEYRRPACLDDLEHQAAQINTLRARLGEPPFDLHARFMQARGDAGANAPGEPKLALRWLAEIAGEG